MHCVDPLWGHCSLGAVRTLIYQCTIYLFIFKKIYFTERD